jgi:hypothetical protein
LGTRFGHHFPENGAFSLNENVSLSKAPIAMRMNGEFWLNSAIVNEAQTRVRVSHRYFIPD